jgi:hypothetical protein
MALRILLGSVLLIALAELHGERLRADASSDDLVVFGTAVERPAGPRMTDRQLVAALDSDQPGPHDRRTAVEAGERKGLTLEIQRDAVSLNGTWGILRDHPRDHVWQPEAAGELPGWRPTEVPGPLLPDVSSKDQEQIQCIWANREFTIDQRHASRLSVLKWNGIRFGATVWINGQKVATHPAVGPATYLLPAGLLKPGSNQIVVLAPGWPKCRRSRPAAGTSISSSWTVNDGNGRAPATKVSSRLRAKYPPIARHASSFTRAICCRNGPAPRHSLSG